MGHDRTGISERLRMAVDGSAGLVALVDAEGRFLYLNGEGCRVLNVAPGVPQHLPPWTEYVAASYRQSLVSEIRGAVDRDGRWQGEAIFEVPDRGLIPFALTVSAHDVDGEPFLSLEGRNVAGEHEVEEVLHRYAERLVALHKLDQQILTAPSSTAVAETAVDHLRGLIPCDRISVSIAGRDDGLTVLAVSDTAPSALRPGQHVPLASDDRDVLPKWTQVWSVSDLEKGGPQAFRDSILVGEGIRSMLGIPLVSHDEVIGMVNLGARRPNAFTSEHLDVVREVSAPLSVGIQNALLMEELQAAHERMAHLSRRLVEVQESERRHIALELHDEIGQMLTALKLALTPDDKSGKERRSVDLPRARALVDTLTSQVRDLSLDLRPSLLDDLGLLPALLRYFKRYEEQTSLRVEFMHAGLADRRFGLDIETAAFRIVQEALTNAARHAGVERVRVRAWLQDGMLHLQVVDEGVGFDPTHALAAASTGGLSGMRERAVLLGGDVRIESSPGEGGQVHAVLPVEPDVVA